MFKSASKLDLLEKLYLEILDDVNCNNGDSVSDSGSAVFKIDDFEIKLKIEYKGLRLKLISSDD